MKIKGSVEITKNNQEQWFEKLKETTEVAGNLYICSDAELEALKSVGGNLYICSDAELDAPQLKSVGGGLYICSELDEKLEKRLWKHNRKNTWIMTEKCSDWLLARKGNIKYEIQNVVFDKPLFLKIRGGQLTAAEVFQLRDMEQRRIAYEFLDKAKMRELGSFKVLDEAVDQQGKPMSIVEFEVEGYSQPFRYLHCVDPSTDREYFLERANDEACWKAKMGSFGLSEKHRFTKEW